MLLNWKDVGMAVNGVLVYTVLFTILSAFKLITTPDLSLVEVITAYFAILMILLAIGFITIIIEILWGFASRYVRCYNDKFKEMESIRQERLKEEDGK